MLAMGLANSSVMVPEIVSADAVPAVKAAKKRAMATTNGLIVCSSRTNLMASYSFLHDVLSFLAAAYDQTTGVKGIYGTGFQYKRQSVCCVNQGLLDNLSESVALSLPLS